METNNNMFESFLNDILNTLGISSLDSYSIDEKKKLIKQVVKNDVEIVNIINKGEVPQDKTFFSNLSSKYPDMSKTEAKAVDAAPKVAKPADPADTSAATKPPTDTSPVSTETTTSSLVNEEELMAEAVKIAIEKRLKGDPIDKDSYMKEIFNPCK